MNVLEATNYLKGLDLASLEVGKYVVDDDFYYMIQEYETQDISQCKMESHDKWIDIQWIISGVEAIETTDVSRLTVKVPYNPEKDITFFETPAVMQHNVLTEGSYVVLYPENGHMPKVAVEGSVHVKKCVAKIRA